MMRRLLQIAVMVSLALTLFVAPAAAQNLREIDHLVDGWQMPQAKAALATFDEKSPGVPDSAYLHGRIAFFEGRYDEAIQRLDQALTLQARDDWKELRDLVVATRDVTKSHEVHKSPKGYFQMSIPPGKDRVLLPLAFEALDDAYEAFAEELGFKPPTPIRVEVYDKTAVLATVSVLTEEEIRTSGTIALCKYNRLMITSPRALLQGYGWVDTLVHEYVHYVINQRTQSRVPIWMHEGLAKFLERRWRGPEAHRLPPSTEQLLQDRVAADNLITFAQMHPSMAKLPSQEDAGVAFAEVYTAMEYLREKAGKTAFKQLLDRIADGAEATEAFAAVLGVPFAQFEREWRVALKSRPPVDFPRDSGYEEKLVFKDDVSAKSELSQIEQPQARDHINLGQMLHGRGRAGAAVVQYRKAIALSGDKNPVIQTRLAQVLLADGRAQEAAEALLPIRDTFPSYVGTWIQLGRASYELGKYAEARDYLEEAARINPFDPEVHERLAMVYEKLGQVDRAKQSRDFTALVR